MIICFFCGHKPMDATSSIELPVYQLTKYNHLIVARRFEYAKQLIMVPRCTQCATVHAKAKKKCKDAIITGAAIGFIIGFPIAGVCLFTATAGGVTSYLISNARAKKLCNQLQIKALSQATLRGYPSVADKLREGWKLDKPGGSIFTKKLWVSL